MVEAVWYLVRLQRSDRQHAQSKQGSSDLDQHQRPSEERERAVRKIRETHTSFERALSSTGFSAAGALALRGTAVVATGGVWVSADMLVAREGRCGWGSARLFERASRLTVAADVLPERPSSLRPDVSMRLPRLRLFTGGPECSLCEIAKADLATVKAKVPSNLPLRSSSSPL
jgi:hypothetical protein